jgi:hypothetical protein
MDNVEPANFADFLRRFRSYSVKKLDPNLHKCGFYVFCAFMVPTMNKKSKKL